MMTLSDRALKNFGITKPKLEDFFVRSLNLFVDRISCEEFVVSTSAAIFNATNHYTTLNILK
ncbi:MAG: hypothetical protein N2235_23025 [Fischerella sp.]|nr:hypothetical protein [Fischerella sp.]